MQLRSEERIKLGLSVWHLLTVVLVALLVFGGSGRISSVMGDIAKGVKSLKNGLSEDAQVPEPPKEIDYTGSKTPDRKSNHNWTS